MSMISVVIPTYNRSAVLEQVISDVVDQLATTEVSGELIVVDNNSTDGTCDLVNRVISENPSIDIRYVFEATQGVSAARNAGIKAAQGQIILFTDDDVRVGDGWLKNLVSAFGDRSVIAAAGRFWPSWPGEAPMWAGPLKSPFFPGVVGHFDLGDRPIWLVPGDPLPFGANMAFRRQVFDQVGYFNQSLG